MKNKLDKIAVASRFKEWLIREFGSINEGARKIGKNPDALRSNYLNGQSLPGAPLLAEMMQYGCDIYWLFWGDEITVTNKNKLYYENKIIKLENSVKESKVELQNLRIELENSSKKIDKIVEKML